MKSLGKIIKNKTGAKNLEALTKLIKKAPYSQPIQKLGKELLDDNTKDILLRYDWTAESIDDEDIDAQEAGVSMDKIKFKKAKKKDSKNSKTDKKVKESNNNAITKKKKKDTKSKKSENQGTKKLNKKVDTSEDNKPKESKPKKTKKTKSKAPKLSKKSKSNKSTEELDDYTVWLNSLKNPQITELLEAKKIKAKAKKKKSKKKNKKNPLKEKIESSVKANDKIASKSLAKLYIKKGHYKKAIKVYKELSLKNPGKSGFFAAQIQKLKDKL